MEKKFHCGKCHKEIKSGSVCNKCTSKIDKEVNSIIRSLHRAASKIEKEKQKQG